MKMMITGRYVGENEIQNIQLREEMRMEKQEMLQGFKTAVKVGSRSMWKEIDGIISAALCFNGQKDIKIANAEQLVWIADKIARIQPESAAEHYGIFAAEENPAFRQIQSQYDTGAELARKQAFAVLDDLTERSKSIKPTFRIAMAIGGKMFKAEIPFEDRYETPHKALDMALQKLKAYLDKHPECRDGSRLTIMQDITQTVGFDARKEIAEKWGSEPEIEYSIDVNPAVSRNLYQRIWNPNSGESVRSHFKKGDLIIAVPPEGSDIAEELAIYGCVVYADRNADTIIIDRYQGFGATGISPCELSLLETELSGAFRHMESEEIRQFFTFLDSADMRFYNKAGHQDNAIRAQTYDIVAAVAGADRDSEQHGKEQLYEAS